MIGKLKKGCSFVGCIRYVTGKDEAKIIASDGVLLGTNAEMTQSFELQRQLNPRIKKPVGHIALSFKPEDKPRLTDEFMAKIALEYMQMMGINDTQFIIVRHHNTDNPHCHIVYNRINNDGKLISDRNDYRRNEQVTKALKSKYGFTYGTDKSKTNTRKLRNAERAKYEIHNAVKDVLKGADSWQKFKNELAKRGVLLELVYKDKERTKVQGIRFCKDGYSFMLPSASDTAKSRPSGPLPLSWSVMEPSSTFCMLPIMDAAVKSLPSAAVAVGSVLWICRARSTMPVVVTATAFTKPSFVMARTSSSFIVSPSLRKNKCAARPASVRAARGRRTAGHA